MSSVSGSRGLADWGEVGWLAEESRESSSSSEGVASSPRPSGGGSPSPPSPATHNHQVTHRIRQGNSYTHTEKCIKQYAILIYRVFVKELQVC